MARISAPPLSAAVVLLALACSTSSTESLPGGDPSSAVQGMRLEGYERTGGVTTIRTTGAVFRADAGARRMTVEQRIGGERAVATIHFGDDVAAVLARTPRMDGFEYVWEGRSPQEPTIVVAGDSTIRFHDLRTLQVEVAFAPEHVHHRTENNGLLAFDERGGVVVIPPRDASPITHPSNVQGNTWALASPQPLEVLFIGVCPPRPFDWQRAATPIVHYASHVRRYPTDPEIVEMSSYARVLELHSWVWKDRHAGAPGYPEIYRNSEGDLTPPWDDLSYVPVGGRWVPEDEAEFIRVIRTAQSLGMQVAPYFGGAMMRAEDVLGEARRLKEAYGVDGLYVDGLPDAPGGEALEGYHLARGLRALFGNAGWLNYHNTHSGYFYPFVQTYMDFITTSEHQDFDRWSSTTRGMSNAIGGLWPEVPYFFPDPASNLEDARPLLKRIVDDSLPHDNRLLILVGEQGQWRFWRLYFTPAELDFVKDYYLKRL